MENNFDLRKFLVENKLTMDSKNEAWGFQSDFAKDLEKRGGTPVRKVDPKVLKVSMGPNAKQEQKVIDIARDAIALMDEQPGTSAVDALKSVLES